jgi:ceramide glucosyltransferase
VFAPALLILLAGSVIYCVLVIIAARRYLAACPAHSKAGPSGVATDAQPISLLKPLSGVDDGLEENLRSCFEQDYPSFEILMAMRRADDPAYNLAQKLISEYPQVPASVILTGEPPYANAKVFSLDAMSRRARHELLVMADSDIRFAPGTLRTLGAEFEDRQVGVITCPYRAHPGPSVWSRLEAIGLNTEFIAGLLVARMLNGMDFAVGCTLALRRGALAAIGGFDVLKDYLAEDFVIGHLAAKSGIGVLLSSCVIEHRIGTQPACVNLRHRLRWVRSTRRSRPWGYVGQVFTNPLPLALLLWVARPAWWWALPATIAVRWLAALATSQWVLHDRLTARYWWLVPVQDLLSFVVWVAGFFGNTVEWRGRRYYLRRDGRFELKYSP